MEDKIIRFETELNLVKAELHALKEDMNHPEKHFITEKDIEAYMKTYSINCYEDLQFMVNHFIKQAFRRQHDL